VHRRHGLRLPDHPGRRIGPDERRPEVVPVRLQRLSLHQLLSFVAPSAIDSWKLAFTLPGGQRITSAWSAGVSFGFQGAYDGSFAKPAGFSLNGTSCTVT